METPVSVDDILLEAALAGDLETIKREIHAKSDALTITDLLVEATNPGCAEIVRFLLERDDYSSFLNEVQSIVYEDEQSMAARLSSIVGKHDILEFLFAVEYSLVIRDKEIIYLMSERLIECIAGFERAILLATQRRNVVCSLTLVPHLGIYRCASRRTTPFNDLPKRFGVVDRITLGILEDMVSKYVDSSDLQKYAQYIKEC